MLKGIDVSFYQGDIDWVKTAKEIDFAILRAGYGTSTKDKKFDRNYTECKKNNVNIGVYWYCYAKNITEAKAEAQGCLNVLKGKSLQYPVWYDIEENSTFSTGKNNVSAMAKIFCDTVAAAGYKVGIYSSRSGLQTYFTDEVKNKYYVWLANVGKNGAALSQTSYTGKKDLWQYSWKGRVNGISGDVDLDYCYTDFTNGIVPEKPADTPAPAPTQNSNIDVFYKVYNGSKWYPEVKNDTDYAGVEGKNITGLTAKASQGELKYRVHLPNGKWLGWINKSDSNDWNSGVAGIQKKAIDGLQMSYDKNGYVVKYRVSLIGQTKFLPWVTESGNGSNGYAGIFGKLIDKIQIKIEKK